MTPFFISVVCCWAACIAAAAVTYRHHPSASWLWIAALPAFILETLFYLASIFENTREAFHRIRQPRLQAALLWASALLPFFAFYLPLNDLNVRAVGILALLTGVFCFWFAVLPRRPAYDIGFLAVAAAPLLLHVFPRLYPSPTRQIRIDGLLGHLMWLRVGLVALLVLREWNPGPVSFWPSRREWKIGFTWFAAGIVPIALTAIAIGDLTFSPHSGHWYLLAATAVATFFGALWVIAIGEELFSRGIIEKALLRFGPIPAILVSSLVYGATHLGVHQFPNWKRAATTTVLGVFCGIAYWKAGSIRSSMVTHASAVVFWRLLFR